MPGHLFHNGAIVTMVPEGDVPECVLVHQDKVAFVGSLRDARNFAEKSDIDLNTHDLNGAALLPGFIDGHLHPLPMIFFAASANLEQSETLDDVERRLSNQLSALEDGEWLIGVQFEQKLLPDGQTLDAGFLDQVTGERPTLIYARDGHCVIVNSAVLNQLNEDGLASDPEGGHIGRTEDGAPNAIIAALMATPNAVGPALGSSTGYTASKSQYQQAPQAVRNEMGARIPLPTIFSRHTL